MRSPHGTTDLLKNSELDVSTAKLSRWEGHEVPKAPTVVAGLNAAAPEPCRHADGVRPSITTAKR